MREVDLVSQRKEGTNIFYRRTSYGPGTCKAPCSAIDAQTPALKHLRQIDELNQQRAQRSEAFFASNKDVLDQQDELICPTERVPTLRNEQSAESAQGTTARHGSGTRQRRFATAIGQALRSCGGFR